MMVGGSWKQIISKGQDACQEQMTEDLLKPLQFTVRLTLEAEFAQRIAWRLVSITRSGMTFCKISAAHHGKV